MAIELLESVEAEPRLLLPTGSDSMLKLHCFWPQSIDRASSVGRFAVAARLINYSHELSHAQKSPLPKADRCLKGGLGKGPSRLVFDASMQFRGVRSVELSGAVESRSSRFNRKLPDQAASTESPLIHAHHPIHPSNHEYDFGLDRPRPGILSSLCSVSLIVELYKVCEQGERFAGCVVSADC